MELCMLARMQPPDTARRCTQPGLTVGQAIGREAIE